MGLGGGDNVVELLQAVGPGIDRSGGAGPQMVICTAGASNLIETPA